MPTKPQEKNSTLSQIPICHALKIKNHKGIVFDLEATIIYHEAKINKPEARIIDREATPFAPEAIIKEKEATPKD